MSSVSRGDLEAMGRDELIEYILDLSAEVEQIREDLEAAGRNRADIRQDLAKQIGELRKDLQQTQDQLHHERSKLARRVTAVEDEVGITTQDALAVAEAGGDAGGLSRLGLLVRHGPDAVSDRPTERMYRARELVDNWNRWGTIRDDSLGRERRLAAAGDDLKTRLEDAREESLSWTQVYRAMELIDEWSGSTVSLNEGSENEGKYVLVHRPEGEGPA